MEQSVREYELTNHLGNVLSTITDKGVITSAQDYYPFGLTLASRSFTEGESPYRYFFNGKEDDKGLKQQDYGMRIYRYDLGRFLSYDPIAKQYPELTPYQFASNMPINSIDLDGLEAQEIYDAFKWGANKTKNLVVETIVGTVKFGAYAGAMHSLGPVGDVVVAKQVIRGVAQGVKPIKTMAVGFVKILYGTATSTKIDVDQKEFNEAAHSTAKGIVKTAALSVLGEGVGMLAQEARIATVARQAKNGAAESGAVERGVVVEKAAQETAALSRGDRLALFKNELINATKPQNPNEAISLINKSLDKVEDTYSGIPKNPDAIKLSRNDGRMYGILDDTYVTKHSNGSQTALTKGHRIEIQSNGNFSIFERSTGNLFLEKNK